MPRRLIWAACASKRVGRSKRVARLRLDEMRLIARSSLRDYPARRLMSFSSSMLGAENVSLWTSEVRSLARGQNATLQLLRAHKASKCCPKLLKFEELSGIGGFRSNLRRGHTLQSMHIGRWRRGGYPNRSLLPSRD